MKSIRMILTLSLILALTTLTASAQDFLSAKVAGSELRVDWSVACDGECTLTVYRDGWPLNVCGVCGEGSIRIPLNDAAGKYSVRLKAANGCLTADAAAAETGLPATPAAKTTAKPTAAATPVPTAKPTVKPTAAPTPAPTAKPASGSNRSALAEEVVRQVNAERARRRAEREAAKQAGK